VVEWRRIAPRAGAAAVGVAVGWAATGWPAAGVLAGAAATIAPMLVGARRARQTVNERSEALAAWAEMLRDTIGAHAGLREAIALTAPVAPLPAILANADAEADRIVKHGLGHLERSSGNPARSHRIIPGVREALAVDMPLLQPRGVAGTIRHTGPASTVRDRIGGNTRPTLLVAGKKEKVFAEACHYVQTAMPNLTVVRVDAGHSPNAETPDAFNDLAVRFITDNQL
jgi:pimeloyl-ACP methyl ester carboxylesterase